MRRTIFRLLSLFRSKSAEQELSREIGSHLQLLEDEYVARGMHAEEARYAALRAFGGVEQAKEHQRDARTFRWLAGWPMDLKLGGRMLVKYPGLTVVGGLAMAFGIWVGLITFQVVGLAIHPTLPLPKGDRLVELHTVDVAENDDEAQILHDVLEWRGSLRSVTEIGAWRNSHRNLMIAAGDARPVNVAEMSVSGFRVSDGEPLMGRVLVAADEQPSAPPVAVIGYDVWRTRLNSDPNVLGRDVQLGSEHVTVVGVMREGFEFPVSHDVWLPLKTAGLDQAPRSGPAINVFALLAPGETIQTAQAELSTAGRRAATELPATHQHLEPRVRPYAMMMVPGGPDAWLIMSSVSFFVAVLLILICGNVGLLLFARAASRETDLVVRTALGASRGRIVAQMFAEALVLGGLAAIIGVAAADVALGTWGMTFLETNLGRLPFGFDLSLSPRAFAVAIVLTVANAAVAGVLPAMKVTRRMGHRLKQSTAGSGGLQFGGVWTVVIVAQVAATVVFPAAVYWEQSQLRRVENFDAGFATEQYLAVQVERDDAVDPGVKDADTMLARRTRLSATIEELRRRLTAQPGVRAVTFTERVPTTDRPQKVIEMGYDLDDPAATAGGSNAEPPLRRATVAAVEASYFEALDAPMQPFRAAGFYIPATADLFDQIHMMVHVRGGDPMTLAPQPREIATTVDPTLRIVTMQRGHEVNHDLVWTMGLWIRVTAVLSSVALVLSLAGIYAVLSFTVARRTRDIGVRVALGASRQRVVAATFRRPLFQVTGGIVVGTAIVLTFAALLKYTEFPGSETELTIQDMGMIVVYGIVMLGVCMLACLVPTRRALDIEPTIALRTE